MSQTRSVIVEWMVVARIAVNLMDPSHPEWKNIERIAAACESFLLAKARRDADVRIKTLSEFALGREV
jgi:hypothetical protein